MMARHPHVNALFNQERLTLIAGPCVIESYAMCKQIAEEVKTLAITLKLPYIFKASFDKANRTSATSFRGPGLEKGLEILTQIKNDCQVPILTDFHHPEQANRVANVADIIQIPAFLCRQTDMIMAAARTEIPTIIKKGQFLAPEDIIHAVQKYRTYNGHDVAVCERGTFFGYHRLVVDMRALVIMREMKSSVVIFDGTHSVQQPSADAGVTSGERHMVRHLARASTAVGIDGFYCEVHPDPKAAKSDAANSLDFDELKRTMHEVVRIDAARREIDNA